MSSCPSAGSLRGAPDGAPALTLGCGAAEASAMPPVAATTPARLLAARRLVNLDQLACATASVVADGPAAGCRAVDLRVAGGIDVRLLPDRGRDLGAAWSGGTPLAWLSAVGEAAPLASPQGEEWIERFGGGLVTTCGLRNVGVPSEGHGLHGRWSHLRAGRVSLEREVRSDGEVTLRAAATVEEVAALGPHLRVSRTVTSRTGAGVVELTDVAQNVGGEPVAAPLLYHVNLGAPLWAPGAALDLDAVNTVSRDADAAAGLDRHRRPPEPDATAPEQVLEHRVRPGPDGWATATVSTEALVLEVAWDAATLPRFHQWLHPAHGVLGLEPANCSVLGRGADRAAGTLPYLEPGEPRTTRLRITARPASGS